MRRLFETHGVAMLQWDLDRRVVVDANAEFLRLTGYDREDLALGRLKPHDIESGQGAPASGDEIPVLPVQGSAAPYGKEVVRKDGSRVPVLIAGTRFEDAPSQGMSILIDMSEAKRAEAALRRSEHLLQRITAVLPNVVYVMNLAEQSVTWVNPQVATVMGYAAADVVAQGAAFMRNVMHPEDVSLMPATFAQLAHAADGEMVEIEYRLRRPDGTWRWFHARKAPFMRDAAGRVSDIIGTAIDVTDSRLAQEGMRTSEIRYRRLFEAAHDGVLLVDPQTRQIVDVNPFMTRLLGYSRMQLIGRELFEIGLFRDEAASQAMFHRLRAESFIRYENLPLQNQSGKLQEVEVVANLYAEDGHAIIQFNIRDIGERIQAQAALGESEKRFRGTFDNAAVGIAHRAPDGHWLLVNDRFCAITGYTRVELLASSFQRLTHPDDLQAELAKVDALLSGAADSYALDKRCLCKDGSVAWVRLTVSCIRTPQGAVEFFIAIVEDISGNKRTEAGLQQLADALVAADRRKNVFLATLAHELRNPLATLKTSVELMKRGAGDPALMEQVRTMMERQTEQMLRLTEDLLDISRIDHDKLELRKQAVDVNAVLRHAVESIGPRCERAGVELRLALLPQPAQLLADPVRLGQVVGNLLSNACKFTPRGGQVELSVELDEGQVVIRVKDSGIGIATSMLLEVFELFTQVATPAQHHGGGLGIGLSLVKRLVQMHGGSVTAHSQGLGHGSEFIVRLPQGLEAADPHVAVTDAAAVNAAAVAAAGDAVFAAPAPRLRVLVVDDNKDAAQSLAAFLSLAGHDTEMAFDGEQAVAAAPGFDPDVVLLDIGLPKLDGYEVCRALRAQQREPPIVVMALSGWGQEDARRKSQQAGFDEHLLKPVDPSALEQRLATIALAVAARREAAAEAP